MNKLKAIIALGVLAVFVVALIATAQSKPEAAIGSVTIDQPAPDFALKDVDGKEHKLSQYKGKHVVLEWVNYDCPFVKKHYGSGNMQSLQGMFTKKDVVWLSICSSAPGKQGHFPTADLKKRIVTEKATPTAYLIDENGAVGKMYGAKTTPHMFIVDPAGMLRYAGAIDDTPSTRAADIEKSTNYVRSALDNLLTGKSVAVKSSAPYGCSVKY